MQRTLFAHLVMASVVLFVNSQGATADPTYIKTGYAPCEYVSTYPARTTHGIVMQKEAAVPINDFIRQDLKHGLAVAQTYYYAKKTPHLRVILGSTGIPPTFLIKTLRGVALSYNIPNNEKWCEIISQADIRVASIDVYTKGTEPVKGA